MRGALGKLFLAAAIGVLWLGWSAITFAPRLTTAANVTSIGLLLLFALSTGWALKSILTRNR